MKQAIGLLALVALGLEAARAVFGAETVLVVVDGALALMALMIAGTFLWLWLERTTPLALGMAFSWLGAGLIAGGWWLTRLAGGPVRGVSEAGLIVVLGLSLVGAVLHFAVIHRSFGYHGVNFLWPVALALGLSGLVFALV